MSQMPFEPDDTQMTPEPADTQIAPPVSPAPQSRADWRQTFAAQMITNQQLTARWLYERGNWIFGGLIVVALVLLQDLITSGFGFAGQGTHAAGLIAALAIVIALPFELGGVVIVRYSRDLSQATAGDPQARRKTIDTTVSGALFLSVLFTMISIGAALWSISWAVTVLFIIASILSFWLASRATR